MKLSNILASLAPVAFISAAVSAFASTGPSVSEVTSAHNLYERDGEETCGLITVAPLVYILSEQTIVGSAPRAKVWTCGNVEENRVGGSQRTCEYR